MNTNASVSRGLHRGEGCIVRWGKVWAAFFPMLMFLCVFAPLSEGRTGSPAKAVRPSGPVSVSDNQVLAEVNGEKLLVSQLRTLMKKTDYRHARSFFGEDEAKGFAFRDLINERLIVQNMRAADKTRSRDFRSRMGAFRLIAMGNRFLSDYRKGYTPSDNQVRSLLPPAFSDLDIRIHFGQTFDETTKARLAVQNGEDMDRLVREKSVGPGAEKGGLITGYISNTYIPERIEKEAFSSGKGWISPVFETPLGYAFIRVEESRDLPPEKITQAAGEALLWIKQAAGNQKIEEALLEAKVSVDEAKARELDLLPDSRWKEHFGEAVAVVKGRDVRVEDLYWYIFEGRKKVFPAPGSGEVPRLLDALTKYMAIADEAAAAGVDQTPFFRELTRKKSDEVLYEMYLEEIARSVRVSDKEAREFFREKKDSLKTPPGRQIREVQAPDRETIVALLDQLKRNPSEIDRFAVDPGPAAAKNGKGLVVYRGRMDPEDEKKVFDAPVGQLVGPFQRGDLWAIFIVDREVPSVDDPSFEEHAEQAKAMVRKEKRNRIVKERTDELYKKATILTYTEVLKAVGW